MCIKLILSCDIYKTQADYKEWIYSWRNLKYLATANKMGPLILKHFDFPWYLQNKCLLATNMRTEKNVEGDNDRITSKNPQTFGHMSI